MILPSDAEMKRISPASLVVRCALLGMVLAVAAVLVAAVVHRGLNSQAFIAAAIASGVCWLGASLALVATYAGNLYGAPVQGMMVSMIGRIGLPLAALVVLPQFGEDAAAPGVMNTILGVYLVALVVETALALQMVARSSRGSVAVGPAGTKAEGV